MLAELQTCHLCHTLLYFFLKKLKKQALFNIVILKIKLFKFFIYYLNLDIQKSAIVNFNRLIFSYKDP